jgi:catechol 2,3-dioxygenase-like lactoylglutathione lyase family enzyme
VKEVEKSTVYPSFRSFVLFVTNVEKSKYFYNVVLGQKIVMDFGVNVGFEGGLAIWDRDYALNLIFQRQTQNIEVGKNNAEIYFESDSLDDLYERLLKEEIEVIHTIIEQPWGQRVFRVYDSDNHIVEFAETMAQVVLRLDTNGFSLEEISEKSLMPIEFIKMVLENQ